MAKKKKKRVITDKELKAANRKHDKMYGKSSEQREWNKGVQQFDYIRHHEEQSGNGKLTGWSSRFQNVFPVPERVRDSKKLPYQLISHNQLIPHKKVISSNPYSFLGDILRRDKN